MELCGPIFTAALSTERPMQFSQGMPCSSKVPLILVKISLAVPLLVPLVVHILKNWWTTLLPIKTRTVSGFIFSTPIIMTSYNQSDVQVDRCLRIHKANVLQRRKISSLGNTSVIRPISNKGIRGFFHLLHKLLCEIWCECFIDNAGWLCPGTPVLLRCLRVSKTFF